MEVDGLSKIHHMKYKRTQPWERDLRCGGGEEKMPLPKLQRKLGEQNITTQDLSKLDIKPELDQRLYGNDKLKVTVAKPRTVMKQIVVTQDLSNRNNDNLTSVYTCGEDTAFMEDEPEQRRKCGETKVFLEEMKK